MSQIRWDELSEARELARLGKELSRTAQARLQWTLFYYFNGRNAQRTCRHFGISRQTFYCWKRRFDRHDLATLEERSHRPRKVRKPTWTVELAERVLSLRQQYSTRAGARTSWRCCCAENHATFPRRWRGAFWRT